MTGGPLDALAAALGDRYRIERRLGEGGMATVYLAEDLKHHRMVALKVLRPELAAALGPERFLREIETTAGLRHPNILPLYDSGSFASRSGGPEDLLYYVMPYVEGESLRERLQRERQLPIADALRLAGEVADALGYAHERGVVHRDIKPDNILLERGHAVVADFGIARALGGEGASMLTETGVAVGTPAYMSPEQSLGERTIDGRTDLYALGCVLYEMLAGEPAYSGATAQAIIARRFRDAVPRVTTLRDTVSPSIEAAIVRALSTSPADRFATAADFKRALAAGDIAVVPASRTPSVAVLPFVNMSADAENEYFSDGMTEELISVLTRTPGLRVASRSSAFAYKGKSEDARVVGRALNVETVLAGSVRKAGNRIRLVAQLTTVADGYQVWSDTYDRELRDVFAVQDEVAQAIARALQVRLAPAAGAAARTQGTVNVDAYTHYLRGRFHWARRTEAELAKGLLHFQQALALDPDYALAEIGIADSYNLLGFYDWIHPREAFPRALAAAERALTLDDNLAAAHCSRAYVRLYHEWNWAAAEDGFRRAEALAPAYATASHQYGNLLVTQGRFAEAEAAMRRALASEPMALITNACIGWAEYYAGKWEASIAHHRATIELDASFMLAHLWLGQSLLQAGAAEDAVEEFETALRLSGRSAIALAALARALVVAGRRAESDRLVSELDELAQRRFVPQYDVATIHAAAGDADRAFARLDQALREREHELVFLAVDPALVSLRGDPRFAALVARVGL